MAGSLNRRRRRRVGTLGPAYSFSDLITKEYFFGEEYDIVYLPTISDVVEAVSPLPPFAKKGERVRVQLGVVPCENSSGGPVYETIDNLLELPDVKICRELVLPVVQCLIVSPGTEREHIRQIFTHPQSHLQCRRYLRNKFPGIPVTEMKSNSLAVGEALRTVGAAGIGPRQAGEYYQGVVLEEGVQDAGELNKTRFWVIADHDAERHSGHSYKTAVVFTLPDKKGMLVRALNQITDRDMNINNIQSRPTGILGYYMFLLEFEAHRTDPRAEAALQALKGHSGVGGVFKVLGSFEKVPQAD